MISEKIDLILRVEDDLFGVLGCPLTAYDELKKKLYILSDVRHF